MNFIIVNFNSFFMFKFFYKDQFIKIVLLFFFLFFTVHGQNLVPNPDFENYSTCPTNLSQTNLATPWDLALPICTSDYFNACSNTTSPFIGVPDNFSGTQSANSGDAYVGFYGQIVNSDYSEYVTVPLNSSLVAGNTYHVSFYVSLAENSDLASKNIGAYFTDTLVTGCPGTFGFFNLYCHTPQIQETNFLTDKLNWTQVSQCFVADGGESYITIGLFTDNSPILSVTGAIPSFSYYYLDDVSVELLTDGDLFDDNYCLYDSISLEASGFMASNVSSIDYLWQDGSTDSSFLVTEPGTYWLEMTLGTGCTIRDTVYIDSYMDFDLSTDNDTSLCDGDVLLLEEDFPNFSYLWSDSSTGPSLEVTSSGHYWLEISNGDCTIRDSIFVQYYPEILLNLGADTVLCEGEILNLNVSNPDANYLWQDGSSSSSYAVSESGIYIVEISNTGQCYAIDSIEVEVIPAFPDIHLGPDTTVLFCEGEFLEYDLPEIDDADYLWSNGSTGKHILIEEPGIYWVDISDRCSSIRDSIVIIGCQSSLVYPNSFSPNSDGNNDFFHPGYIEHINHGTIQIYDRWGKLIYNSSDIMEGWDGTWNGKECSADIYIFKVDYFDFKGQGYTLNGTVTIIR